MRQFQNGLDFQRQQYGKVNISYLYEHPEHYEIVFPTGKRHARMCFAMANQYLADAPRTTLDVGCGTGRDLSHLQLVCPIAWGVDLSEAMIGYARAHYPNIVFSVGDMRTFRLGAEFDLVTCLGSALAYSLTQQDLCDSLQTLSVHTRKGGLLVLGLKNAAFLLGNGASLQEFIFDVKHPQLVAVGRDEFKLDRRAQVLIRTRTWKLWGHQEVVDLSRFRLLFPTELEYLLKEHGFMVCGMFDNPDLRDSELSGTYLYVAALKQ
jgi:SAM-dependent methyltransferase